MVNLRVQAGSTLSNVDIIKLHLYYEGPATAEELVGEVSRLMRAAPSFDRALNTYVLPVLSNKGLFVKDGDKYTIDLSQLPEHQVVQEVFVRERRFIGEKELKSLVAKVLDIKVNSVAISPERVPGLKRFDKRWGLASWRSINDEAYELIRERRGGFSEREILKIVIDAGFASDETAIFDPESDPRFKRDRKNWRVVLEGEAEQTSKPKKQKFKAKVKLDKNLETDFVRAQLQKDSLKTQKRDTGDKLKKVLIKKMVSDKLKDLSSESYVIDAPSATYPEKLRNIFEEDRHDLETRDDFDKVTSYQRVEDAPREAGLSSKERIAINAFLEKLVTSDEFQPLSDHAIGVAGPLSAPKVERIVYHRYSDYSTQRSLIPDEYNRLLVDILDPKVNELVLNPAMQVGNLAVATLNYLYEEMAGMYWALGDNEGLQLVTRRGDKLTLDARDTQLIESVKENFVLNKNELLSNFIECNFCGIDSDPILTQAAKIFLRLSGYEDVFMVCKDFLTELPEVFGQPANPENDIDLVFQVILGNVTFKNNHNVVANFIDQAMRILAADGRIGYFLRWDFLRLMDGHEFLDIIQSRYYFDVILKLTGIPGEPELAIVVIKPRDYDYTPPIRFGCISSSVEIQRCLSQIRSESSGDLLKLVKQDSFSTLFDWVG